MIMVTVTLNVDDLLDSCTRSKILVSFIHRSINCG
ncbi:unnamed protein product [Enterobius vermicularis]|uniref:Uncharacterized protein n=1 Tax=Enterobius vermicularis TaxID=51028 RepID=A0A0N4UU55_ENTVE|nr:unnamed protein product [Enterobius vermicularis]